MEQSRALALMAYVMDMASAQPVDPDVIDALADAVIGDMGERARLLDAAARSQDPHLPVHLSDVLGARLSRLRAARTALLDRDEVIGIWGQRMAAGGIVAALGAVLGAMLSGPWAALGVAGTLAAGAAVTEARRRLRARARDLQLRIEEAERLIDAIGKVSGKGG